MKNLIQYLILIYLFTLPFACKSNEEAQEETNGILKSEETPEETNGILKSEETPEETNGILKSEETPEETNETLSAEIEQLGTLSIETIKNILMASGPLDVSRFLGSLGLEINSFMYSIDFYKVIYDVEFNGNTFKASALIVVPQRGDTELSLVSVQHRTINANRLRPSNWNFILGLSEQTLPESFLDSIVGGHLAVEIDYIGFGDSADTFDVHPYHVADAYAADGIAAIKVARWFAENNNIKLNGNLFLRGYSEGGFATLALQRKIEENAELLREMNITAVAAGAGAYDLLYTSSEFISGRFSGNILPVPSYILYAYLSYEQTYDWDKNRFSSIFQVNESMIRPLFDGSKKTTEIDSQLSNIIDELLHPAAITGLSNPNIIETNEMIAIKDLKLKLRQNSVHSGWEPEAPIRLYVCTNDDIVPSGNTLVHAKGLVEENIVTPEEHVNLPKKESAIVEEDDVSQRHSNCSLYASPITEWFNKF